MKARLLTLSILASVTLCAASGASAADEADLGFESAFPRAFYQKKYFGLAVTGATVVAAGAFTYFTAGAGAPAAATGVSTVASWVAGGGAGSYMAGLSTIGGWFGGNAMLGAAVLNGVSLGTVGGMGAWKTLSTVERALVLGSTAATAMDGIALIGKPGTPGLEWRVMLPVPSRLADKWIADLIDEVNELNDDLAKLSAALESAKKGSSDPAKKKNKIEAAQKSLAEAKEKHKKYLDRIDAEVSRAVKSGDSARNMLVLAVLAHNSGKTREFQSLLRQISAKPIRQRSYFDYILAVDALESGRINQAEALLYDSIKAAKFAIEPPVLLVTVLGSRGYGSHEGRIDEIAGYADKHFDDDAYNPAASPISLHYRIGGMALRGKQCAKALSEFKKAQSELSMIQKLRGNEDVRSLLDIGEANALYCQDKVVDAYAVFKKAWDRTETQDARDLLCMQFSGGCSRR